MAHRTNTIPKARIEVLKYLQRGDASGPDMADDLAARCRTKDVVRRAIISAHKLGWIDEVRKQGTASTWRLTDAGRAEFHRLFWAPFLGGASGPAMRAAAGWDGSVRIICDKGIVTKIETAIVIVGEENKVV